MKDSKLVHLFGQIPKPDRRRFALFLASPYFNKREDVATLAGELERRFFETGEGGRENEIWEAIYPGKKWQASRFNNLKTALQNLLLDFMAQTAFESDPAARNKFLLQRLNQIGERRYFPNYHKKALQQLEKSELPESDRLLERVALEEAFNEYHRRHGDPKTPDHLQEEVDALNEAFLLRAYHAMIQNLDRETILGKPLDLKWAGELVRRQDLQAEELSPLAYGYHLLYRLRAEAEPEAAYHQMRDFLRQGSGEISKQETLNLYIGLVNFAARQLNSGRLEYLQDIFQHYRDILQREILLYKNKIPAQQFKNIVNVALRCRQFDWAQNFITEYQGRVDRDYKGNLITYSRALTHFHTGNHADAESGFHHLLQDYQDVFFGLDARAHLLQVYYETGDSLALESLAHSFRMFLDRNKAVSHERRRQYIDFILHLKRLCNTPLHDRKRLGKLRQDIQAKKERGMGTRWLMEKILELEGA